ncbi:MAG: sigma 54-interacting transcriptional regulator [Myxococcota bacterium]|nr:sigma 54-interacting transcriptional regulator [Myxococcota bacterium]
MPEITSAISGQNPKQIHIRRARITCTSGADSGQSWQIDRDFILIGSLPDGDVVLTDPTVSRQHAEIARTKGGVVLRDLGSTNGTYVGSVKVKEVFLGVDMRFKVGRTELIFAADDEVIDVEPSTADRFEDLVGASVNMRQVFSILERIAPTDLTVLITGETGTGKELASRAVHNRSNRKKGPFVVFDCGAAPENLVESELFGHNRGAFTGAVSARPGVFELASGGTIFLDEIGELPLELQPKLLRVLEQREVRRIGGSRTNSVDVRIVAATNRNLREEVEAGRFREDLYYRLNVVRVKVPPVRERREDIPLLAGVLLRRAAERLGRDVDGIEPDALATLTKHGWPGNVRQLENALERAVLLSTSGRIREEDLPQEVRLGRDVGVEEGDLSIKRGTAILERDLIVRALAQTGGNRSQAAKLLEISYKALCYKIRDYGVET